jgi:flavin-binding protein dodecin
MSVYRVTEVIGTSVKSWEDAAQQAVSAASRSLRDLRVAEVVAQDLTLGEDGGVESYRTKLRLSFKYEEPLGAPEWQDQAARRPVEA